MTHIHSPEPIPANDQRPKVFLAGTIDMGNSVDWQAALAHSLEAENVILLNPRRSDWNKDWKPVITDTNFKAQVEWELAALEQSDIIIMYFAPSSQSPVTLLEMGLHAKSGKLIVLCPDGYFRKGNVDVVCMRYGVEQVSTMDDLLSSLKKRLHPLP